MLSKILKCELKITEYNSKAKKDKMLITKVTKCLDAKKKAGHIKLKISKC